MGLARAGQARWKWTRKCPIMPVTAAHVCPSGLIDQDVRALFRRSHLLSSVGGAKRLERAIDLYWRPSTPSKTSEADSRDSAH
ncbi:uncharacterized protein SPSK_05752 [Sporothrix schenckii 1099-18]|uniref:Uncharacterized protein n=1 Tax=Sporothrix schenckii 1099-18 TaxID=1397361 RepID=A0A0F2LUE3_SPOSC|nr:uncharacterized protein SPSK_05752 [Sporothrix schenckii 1099-18]KJR81087.1 hypothetical protein SPSK_05752 [Sporothrix schenckii 1099-18]